MILNIGGREYEIHLGISAISYLDSVYSFKNEEVGVELGAGVSFLSVQLGLGNVLALVHFIKAGTSTEAQKPSNKQIEGFIASLTDEEYDSLFMEATEELKKQPLTARTLRKMETRVEQARKGMAEEE